MLDAPLEIMNQPDDARAAVMHNDMGNALKNAGQLDRAVACYALAARCNPRVTAIHLNLANTTRLLGRPQEALAHARQAVHLGPQVAEAHYELGAALHDLASLEEAVAAFQEAIHLRPGFPEAFNRLGLIYLRQGRLEEAVNSHRQAVTLRPGYVEGHYNLGNALRTAGRREEASVCYRQAASLEPHCAEAWYSLGGLCAEQEDLEMAAAHFEKAVHLKPDLAAAHGALGVALAEQGRIEEAGARLEHALRLRADTRLSIVLATRLPVIYQSVAELEEWRQRLTENVRLLQQRQVLLDITEEPAVNLFYLAYQGRNDRDLQAAVAGLHRAPVESNAKPRAANSGKIRVGFISCYFRAHTIGHWMRGLIALLSRDDFEVTVLSIGNHHDEVADFIKQHADRALEVPKHLPSARRLIASLRLDVLVYADIGMEPFAETLAFSRLAPVQCVTLGHPVTTGIDTIDYFISTEDLETEEADEHYTEKLVRLKKLPFYYYRPALPPLRHDREHFGLARASHVYACTQSLFKLHPEFDETLGAILRADPEGLLVLFQGLRPHWEELLKRRFAATLPDVISRIRFLPRLKFPEYVNLLAVADVLLDTPHFGGGSTSFEGLAIGTPIITMPSRLLRGRITYALYKQMDVPDCVAQSPGEYVDIATRLAQDADYRQAIREKILAANSVLYENKEGIRELEQFFHQAVSLAIKGAP